MPIPCFLKCVQAGIDVGQIPKMKADSENSSQCTKKLSTFIFNKLLIYQSKKYIHLRDSEQPSEASQ